MIPINMISKLARSRSIIALGTKTFVTTGTLFKDNQSGQRDEGPKRPEEHEHLEKKKQGEGSSSGPKQSLDSYPKEKKEKDSSCGPRQALDTHPKEKESSYGPKQSPDTHPQEKHKTPKTTSLKSDGDVTEKYRSQNLKSSGCGCPQYAKPKYMEGKDSQKSTSCPEKDSPKRSKYENESESEPKAEPCESRRSKRPREEDRCDTQKETAPPEKKNCAGDDTPKRLNYCGPGESSYKDISREVKENCEPKISSNSNTECEDPCGSSRSKEARPDDCEKKSDSCETKKTICPDECERPKAKTQLKLDPCAMLQKNNCPEVKEEVCLDEQKQDDCCEDPCKIEIKIPEVSPCCKVEKALECICKLKELQRQWEEVVAAHESMKDDCCTKPQSQKLYKSDCQEPKQNRSDCPEPKQRKHNRSNMIYVVLGAVLAAVVYYTYNGDFEPEKLFLEDDEDNDDDD